MDNSQWAVLGRYAAAIVGGYAVSKGISAQDVSVLSQAVLDIGGAITVAAPVIVGVLKSSKAARVAQVSAMPEVKGMHIADPALARAAAQADPTTAVTISR